MSVDTFGFPTTIHFGPGSRRLLTAELSALGVRRPLLVTDSGVAGLGFFEELMELAQADGSEAAVFADLSGDPLVSHVSAGADAFADHGADGVVAVGGGAAVDTAKLVALMATHPGEVFDYEDEVPGARTVTDAVVPIVALPTTAGTGSEVGRSAVVADDENHVKRIVCGTPLLPNPVLADPELTRDLPAPLTAATGMDALTHNVEAYLARNYHPMCEGIALEGMQMVAASLGKAVAQPHDIEARSSMLMAAMMGAVAFQKGLGVVHSCAHALGTVAGIHHGLANAVMIDFALELNVEVAPRKFEEMASRLGLADPTTSGFMRWLGDLKAEIGVPRSLLDLEIEPSLEADLVDVAVDDVCHLNNPRPVAREDFAAIFRRALT